MTGPLEGVRVLELARVLAGPWAGQLLADFGAEVIKIEHPHGGDETRSWGPPFLADTMGRATAESAYYLAANRGKHSVAIDFSGPEGQRLVRGLVARCDILIENFRVGTLARYRLDWESLRAIHPGLVYCSLTGFGQTGPRAAQPGYDAAIQAMGGLMSLTGVPEDQPGGSPQKVGVAVADLMAGMYAANAVQAALRHRDRTGEGQHIDLSLLDAQVAMLANQAANYLVGGQVPQRQGSAHPSIVPYQPFATADGHLMVAVGNDRQFARFASAIGQPDWSGQARFSTNAARVAHRDELIAAIKPILIRKTTAEWLDALGRNEVPAAPINDLAAVFDEAQVRHRGMVRELHHPHQPRLRLVANPVRFSRTSIVPGRAPPLLGADTAAVLRSCLGLTEGEIQRLQKVGVIRLGPDAIDDRS